MGKYFITGATGTVGREVVRALLEEGHHVVAASRQPEKSSSIWGSEVAPVAFDYADPSTYTHANGVDGIFLLGPPMTPTLFELLEPFVNHLIDQGPERVVYLSGRNMDTLNTLTFHRDMEAKLKASNLDWRIAQPDFFAQNFSNYERQGIEGQKVVFVPAGDGRVGFVSARDIGDSVAALLTKDEFRHQTFALTGPENHSFGDAAGILTEVLGEPIHYANPDPETYKKVLLDAGMPAFVGGYMDVIYGMVRDGDPLDVTDSVERLTGHKPESLRTVIERDFS